MELVVAAFIGLGAGVVSGLFGVGGGVVFVPALVLVLGLGQAEAEATSLLAIVPVAAVGAWRQHTYGNVRVRDGLWIGLLAVPGAIGAAALATSIGDPALKWLFAGLCVAVAARMILRAIRMPPAASTDD